MVAIDSGDLLSVNPITDSDPDDQNEFNRNTTYNTEAIRKASKGLETPIFFRVPVLGSATITVLSGYIGFYDIDTSTGAYTITLPQVTQLKENDSFLISDGKQNASNNLITINPNGITIEGVSGNITINKDSGKVWLKFRKINGVPDYAIIIDDSKTQGAKEVFFHGSEYDTDIGDYRLKFISANGIQNFSFKVPNDFNTLDSIELIILPVNTNASADIDLDSDYALTGELSNTNSESEAANTYSLSANTWTSIDISPVFSSLQANHRCGLKVTLNGVTGGINALGIQLRYL